MYVRKEMEKEGVIRARESAFFPFTQEKNPE